MTDQPMPTLGDQDVTPIVCESFVETLKERHQRGIETYGGIADFRNQSTTYAVSPAPQSSVTLTQGAKGDTRCEVKVYAADVTEAARLACEQYDALVTKYSPAQGDPS